MTPTRLSILFLLSVFSMTATVRSADPKPGSDWPSFRGIRASGVAEGFPTLTTWDIPKKQGLRWRTALDGLGTSSPIVWGDRVCITTAVSGKLDSNLKIGLYGDITSVEDNTSHTWKIVCLNKKTGRVVVDTTIQTGVPKVKRHTKSTHANSTLATDGNNLVAMFGSEGLYTLDMNGKFVWKKDLGVLDSGYYQVPQAQWEFGSSPIIHEGIVVIQADVQKDSFLAAFDIKDGRELWRTPSKTCPHGARPRFIRSAIRHRSS
jgi:outer membrane protein assembly factor BamB